MVVSMVYMVIYGVLKQITRCFWRLKPAETKDSDGLLSIQSSNLLSGAMGPVRRSGRDSGMVIWYLYPWDIYHR